MSNPLFIIGNPRSGTTLLRLILNSHPSICIPPECGHIVWWYDKYRNWNHLYCNNTNRTNSYINDLHSSKKFDTWGVSKDLIYKYIKNSQPKNYSDLAACAFHAYSDRSNRDCAIWGDKNNFYLHHIKLLSHIYPKACFIHIIRDGRDVACSYIDVSQRHISSEHAPKLSSDINIIASEWATNVQKIYNDLNSISAHHITIKYEELVRQPEYICNSICNFLKVDYSSEMLHYYLNENNDNYQEPRDFIQWKEKVKKPPVDESVGRYLSELSKADIKSFQEIANFALIKHNYLI